MILVERRNAMGGKRGSQRFRLGLRPVSYRPRPDRARCGVPRVQRA